MTKNRIASCWLTVNHQCNLRCKWCYAQETGYKKEDVLNVQYIPSIIEILNEKSIRKVTLMGGEPSCYENLPNLVKVLNANGISTVLVTNGVKLSDLNYLNSLKNSGISCIIVSLKGYDKADFKNTTGVNAWEYVLHAMSLLDHNDIPFTVSMVINPTNIFRIIVGIVAAKNAGAKRFSFSFCYDFDIGQKHENGENKRLCFFVYLSNEKQNIPT